MIFGNETPFYLRPLPNRGLRRLDAEARQHYPGYRHPLDYSDMPYTGTGTSKTGVDASVSSSPSPLPFPSNSAASSSSLVADQTAAARSSRAGPVISPVPNAEKQRTLAAARVRDNRRHSSNDQTKSSPGGVVSFNPMYNITEAERVHPQLSPTEKLRHERCLEKATTQARLEVRRQRTAERERQLLQRQLDRIARDEARRALVAGTSMANMESEGRDTITHHCFTVEAQREKDFREASSKHTYFARQRVISERCNQSGFNILTWEPRPEVQVPPAPSRSPPPLHTADMDRLE